MRHARTAELDWHAQCLNQRSSRLAVATSLSDLYQQVQARKHIRERQARLATVGLLPCLLALAVHLAW